MASLIFSGWRLSKGPGCKLRLFWFVRQPARRAYSRACLTGHFPNRSNAQAASAHNRARALSALWFPDRACWRS